MDDRIMRCGIVGSLLLHANQLPLSELESASGHELYVIIGASTRTPSSNIHIKCYLNYLSFYFILIAAGLLF